MQYKYLTISIIANTLYWIPIFWGAIADKYAILVIPSWLFSYIAQIGVGALFALPVITIYGVLNILSAKEKKNILLGVLLNLVTISFIIFTLFSAAGHRN